MSPTATPAMRTLVRYAMCAAVIAAPTILSAHATTNEHEAQHARWGLCCKKEYNNGINDCVAKQSTFLRGDNSVWLDLYVEHSSGSELSLRVITPNGVEIESGVPIVFANHQPDAMRFKKCIDKACIAIGRISAVEKSLLLAAETLRVFITLDEERVIEIPISTAGLSDALDDATNRIARTQTMLSAAKPQPSFEMIAVNLMSQPQNRDRPAISEMYLRAAAANLKSPDRCSASLIVQVKDGQLEFGANKDSFIAMAKKCADQAVVEVAPKDGPEKEQNAVDRAERMLRMSRSSEFVAKYVSSLLAWESALSGTSMPSIVVQSISAAIRNPEPAFEAAVTQSAPIWIPPKLSE